MTNLTDRDSYPNQTGGDAIVASADQQALRYIADRGGTLCTLVSIRGSYSSRVGAQLAISDDGLTAGELADQCLENELVRQSQRLKLKGNAECLTFGSGSPIIDFRLPCGSTIEILIDPAPDLGGVSKVVAQLDDRKMAALPLPSIQTCQLRERIYSPALRVFAFGEGAAANALTDLGRAYGIEVNISPASLALEGLVKINCDPSSAIVLLSHDHEWERVLLPWALQTNALYVGAIGGAKARQKRLEMLKELEVPTDCIERLNAPLGLIPSARHSSAIALSALSQIVAFYEQAQAYIAECEPDISPDN